jgi:hypothetical protein
VSESQRENVTKRDRQKQRREAKLAAERAAAARARRNRLFVFAFLGAVVLAGIGVVVQRQLSARAAQQAQVQAVADNLEALGCTPDEQQPDLGGGHLSGTPEELVAEPPAALYPDRPASSGRHLGQVAKTGVYDTLVDERLLVHNLEHGYINVYYGEGAAPEQISELKTWAQEQIDGDFDHMIVTPWTGDALPDEANFAYTAWGFRQLCREFDPEVAEVFTRAHHGSAGIAPEKTIPAHTGTDQQGVLDPTEENILFPPLDTELGGGEPNAGTQAPTEPVEGSTEQGPGPDSAPDSPLDPSLEPLSGTEGPPTETAS